MTNSNVSKKCVQSHIEQIKGMTSLLRSRSHSGKIVKKLVNRISEN